jgi:uncharacterized protein (TIGR02145 family)
MSLLNKSFGKTKSIDEGKTETKTYQSEVFYNSGFFVFDWKSMDCYYGEQAFDAIYAALSSSVGTCVFNDGDIFSVSTVEGLLKNAKKVIAYNDKSPLNNYSNKNLNDYGFYFASMWTDNKTIFEKVNKYLANAFFMGGYLGYFLVGDFEYKEFLNLTSSLSLPIGLGLRDGEVLKGMTKYGIGINKKTDVELIRAAQRGNFDAVKKAVSEGAAIDCVYEDDTVSTPLFHAASEGYAEIVRYLIQKGANPNAKNLVNTALMLAARGGYIEVIKELIIGKVNINETDSEGSTAFDNASDYPEIQKLLKNPSLVFPQKETDLNIINNLQTGNRETEANQSKIVVSDKKEIIPGGITGIDGNAYKTVKIGTQEWMAENLNVEHYRNGDVIPEVQNDNEWRNLTTGAWCYYENNSENEKTYGKLYNWYAVNDFRGLAPKGWHVPSDAEWITLTNYLGGTEIACGKLKAIILWEPPNKGATNSSGFSAFPGGFRDCKWGFCNSIGAGGSFWSASESSYTSAWFRGLHYGSSVVYRNYDYKRKGFSVRCVRD